LAGHTNMAQTGYTPISIYYSSTATNVPTAGNLVAGELAINTADGKLFYKDSAGVVQVIGTKGGVGSSSTTQVLYNSSGLVVGSANLTFDGTNLGVGTAPTTYSGYTTLALNNATNGGLLDIQLAGSRIGSFMAGSSTELRMYAGASVVSTFYAGGSERMRIETNGNITLSASDARINGGTTAGRMIMANSDTTCYAIAYGSASGTPAQFVVVTNTNKVTTINGTGNLVLTGGTAAASGVGVTFPATQSASSDANCLDDYEEGTWTPSIGGTAVYTAQDGRYTKIGNFVKIRFLLSVNVKGTGSATTITGIPFAPSAASPTITGGVVCYATNLAISANILGIYCQNSGNIYFFTRDGAGTGATTQQPAVIGNSFAAYCELSYMID
jgi:hypothetical protein